MDFLGIGVPELIVIIILALVFIGPHEMPKMANRTAKWIRSLRKMSEGFTTEWQREINATISLDELKELKEELDAAKKSLQSLTTGITNVGDDIKNTVQSAAPTDNTIASPATPKPTLPEAAQDKAADAPPAESPQPEAAQQDAPNAAEEVSPATPATEDTANRD
ncbi:MAG: twin arginine-targeting protein translocase TatB [Anaerolineaceae bacterium 4572_5.2]|nr:MAG: twin arginine-targeting protein translocase TatB [Anaerolineaceae bacterium 4572_5.2]